MTRPVMSQSPSRSENGKHISALTRQSAGYGFGIFVRQFILLLTLPLFLHHMPKEEFGVVAFAIAVTAFVNTLTNAGLPAATFRFFNDSDEESLRRQVLGTALILFFVFAAVPSVTLYAYSDLIASTLLENEQYGSVIRVAAALLLVDTLINYGYVLLRVQMRPWATSFTNIVIIIAQIAIALLLVIFYELGSLGYLIGLVSGEIIGLVILIRLTNRTIFLNYSHAMGVRLFRYGLPLLPATLAIWALQLADRTLIASIGGLEQLAVYEVGAKVAAVVAIAIAPFRTAWPPFAFSVMRTPNAPTIYRDVLTYLLFVSCFIAVGITTFSSDILALIAPSTYDEALEVIPWLVLSQVFFASHMVLSIGPKISKRTWDLTIAAVAAAVAAILVNLLFIPLFGILGAALSSALGYALLAIGSYYIGQKSYPFPLDLRRIFIFATVSAFLIIATGFSDQLQLTYWKEISTKVVLWLSFIPLCYFLGALDLSFIKNFRNLRHGGVPPEPSSK